MAYLVLQNLGDGLASHEEAAGDAHTKHRRKHDSDRLEDMGMMLAHMVHSLVQIFSVIEMSARHGAKESDSHSLEHIRSAARRGSQLLSDAMLFARPESMAHLREHSTESLLSTIERELHAVARTGGLVLETHCLAPDSNDKSIYFDDRLVSHAVRALAHVAEQYGGHGEPARMLVSLMPDLELRVSVTKLVHLSGAETDGQWWTRRAGMELRILRAVASAHGGNLLFAHDEECTTVTLSLPIGEPP